MAAAHPGQVLLSAEAHQALTADVVPGWQARSLGSHLIHGIEAPQQVFQLVVDAAGETLIATDFLSFGERRISFMDGSTLEDLGEISDAHEEGIAQLALSDDGTLLASAGLAGVVKVWDVETRTLVHQIPVSSEGAVGGVGFVGDGNHLSATDNAHGELRRVTIDTEELLDIARSRVTRGLTETECSTYRIDPCPTLDEIRAG